jgi:TIGR03009 family protein
MHSTDLRYRLALVLILSLLAATPLAAQQVTGQNTPRQPAPATGRPQAQAQPPRGQAPPPRTAQRAPAASAPTAGAPKTAAPAGSYPVRRTAATDPRAPIAPGAPGSATSPVPIIPVPTVPFTITAEQERLLDSILMNWEKQSDKVTSYTCTFDRWDVNETFGPKENNYWLTISTGSIKFKAPDNGTYQIDSLNEWEAKKNGYTARTEGLDHWVCNGKSIFEFNHDKKELIERELAPEMRGKAISDGPLPFVFGAKADKLRARYWMRDITPPEKVGESIWLEAWPKYRSDAANYQHAIVILNHRDFMPSALRLALPDGKNMQDYQFSNTQVNNPLSIVATAFAAPRTPWGWKKVVIPAGGPDVVPPSDAPAAAALPPVAPKR